MGPVLLALALLAGAGVWWSRVKPGPPAAAPAGPAPETQPSAAPAPATPTAAKSEDGNRLTRHDADPGPVWLVRFGKSGGTMGPTSTVWNHITATEAGTVNAQWRWMDTRGLLSITATLVSADGSIAAARNGVRGRRYKAFGHNLPDSTTGGSWTARSKDMSFTLRLSGLNPSSRYVFMPLLAGSSTGDSPVRTWKANGALASEGAYEAGGVDGLDVSSPIRPAADGSATLVFFLANDGGASGLNTLAIKELPP